MSVTEKDRPLDGPAHSGWLTSRFASVWTVGALAAALLLLLPSLVVLASLLSPASENWAHLASTVLPAYISNTLTLMALVAVMTGIAGVGTAWLSR